MTKAAPANDAAPIRPAFRCAVSADLFARAMLAISKDECRYYLQGVFVQPCPQGGALLTSTDGHWLINVRDPRGVVEGSGIVTLNKAMRAALKAERSDAMGPSGHASERVVVVGDSGTIKDAVAMMVLSAVPHKPKGHDTEIDPRPSALAMLVKPGRAVLSAQFSEVIIDGKYPDWQRIVPTKVDWKAATPAIDQRLLALAAKGLSQDSKRTPIRCAPSTDSPESGPVLVLPANRPLGTWEGFAVVMPVRAESEMAVPTYWQEPAKAEAA